VLKRTHLDLTDKFRLDLSVTEYRRQQLTEMWENNVHFVVDRRVQCRQGETVIAQITIAEHVDQERHYHWSQNVIVSVSRIGQGVAERRDYNPTNAWIGT
jgi:hypothetical protein